MGSARATPVIVGVGDVINRSHKIEDAREPLQLILEAIQLALQDAGLSSSALQMLQSSINSVDVINTWTWPYTDLANSIAQSLGVKPQHHYVSPHGGNQPAKLMDEAARRISFGSTKVAVITGGEALASLTACAAAKKMPPPRWTKPSETVESVFSPTSRTLVKNLGGLHSIGAPIQVYPLFENSYRAHHGQSIEQNNQESAQLYADFAKVAAQNPFAWNYGKKAETRQTIGTVTKRNRMICFPYPLLMNAFNTVNLAGAVILTSTKYAEELGIPQRKWVYLLGGAGTQDSNDFWKRPNFHSSPSISRSIDAGLEICGLTKNDIDVFDFYSCFPIVPKFAARHLGLSVSQPAKPITLLGGLTSFGGAGNNYSTHAITALTRQIRHGTARTGLILANGGVATYQHVVCLSSNPRRDGSPYPESNPLPETITDIPSPEIALEPEGEAVVETYTVDFNRDGTPSRGHVVGRLKKNGNDNDNGGHRFLANHADQETLNRLASAEQGEPIGLEGWVRPDPQSPGRNLFSFEKMAKL